MTVEQGCKVVRTGGCAAVGQRRAERQCYPAAAPYESGGSGSQAPRAGGVTIINTTQEELMAGKRKTAAKKSKPAAKTSKKTSAARKKKNK